MLRSSAEFGSDHDYQDYLYKEFDRGRLRVETVNQHEGDAMIERALRPRLEPGPYLEVGPGINPYIVSTRREFSAESPYWAMDGGRSKYYTPGVFGWLAPDHPGREDYWALFEEEVASSPQAEFAHILEQDAQHMDLPDHALNEIFMSDVLVTPGVHHDSMLAIAREAARVLRKGGQLVIRDRELPAPRTFKFEAYLALCAALDGAGFTRRALVVDDPERSAKLGELWEVFPISSKGPALRTNSVARTYSYLICELGEPQIEPDPPRSLLRLMSRGLRGRSG